MNTYKITLKSTDIIGVKWLHNIVKFANMGAVIEDRFFTKTSFPHEVTMILETDTDFRIETDMKEGIIVYPVMVAKTKEEMDALNWEGFKKECRAWGVGGKHRDTMLNQYMKATEKHSGAAILGTVEPVPDPTAVKPKPKPKAEAKKEAPVKEEVVEGVVDKQPPPEEVRQE